MADQRDDRILAREAILKTRLANRLMSMTPEQYGAFERRQGWYKDKMARADVEKNTANGPEGHQDR